MRIALVTQAFLPDHIGGGEVYAFNVAKALQRNGHDVCVITRNLELSGEPRFVESTYRGLRMQVLSAPKPDASAYYEDKRLYVWGLNFLKKYKPDVVHVFIFTWMISVVRAATRLGIPIVMTALDFGMFCSNFHLLTRGRALCDGRMERRKCERCQLDNYSTRQKLAYLVTRIVPTTMLDSVRRFARLLSPRDPLLATSIRVNLRELRRCWASAVDDIDILIAPSQVMKRMYQLNGFPAAKIRTLTYGLNEKPAPRLPRKDGSLCFGFVGRFHASKGVNLLAEAFRMLQNSNARLVLCGPLAHEDPASEIIRQLVASDPRVEFRGVAAPDQVGKIRSEFDVLVVPSIWYENAPLTVLEALAQGIPLITSDVEGITEFVADGVNGLTFQRGDAWALAATMKRIIQEPSLLDHLRRGARQVKDLDSNVAEIVSVYAAVIGSAGINRRPIARAKNERAGAEE